MFLSKYWAKVCRLMPNGMYLQWQYHHICGRWLNLKHPVTYAEKLTWMKMHENDTRLSKLVDKYEVREFVKYTIGEEYLIPLLGLYNNTEEIPWESLPERYVLKCTHDSASVVLHRSNEDFDRDAAVKSLKHHLGRSIYWYSREYPYKNLSPRIICEAFLDDNGNPPSDYKFLCFNGEPKYVIVDLDRFNNHQRDCYDMDWNKQNFGTDHEQSDKIQPKPDNFEKMILLTKKLSAGFKHVRVDLYNVSGKIYFGEMTFFPWGGPIWFTPEEWNYKLGELIQID